MRPSEKPKTLSKAKGTNRAQNPDFYRRNPGRLRPAVRAKLPRSRCCGCRRIPQNAGKRQLWRRGMERSARTPSGCGGQTLLRQIVRLPCPPRIVGLRLSQTARRGRGHRGGGRRQSPRLFVGRTNRRHDAQRQKPAAIPQRRPNRPACRRPLRRLGAADCRRHPAALR